MTRVLKLREGLANWRASRADAALRDDPTYGAIPRPARAAPCKQCSGWGVLPYWKREDEQWAETFVACVCANGRAHPRLYPLSMLPDAPVGLDHRQMNAVLTLLLCHPEMTPAEAFSHLPQTHADLGFLFARVGLDLKRLRPRFVAESRMVRFYDRTRRALLHAAREAGRVDDLPF